MNAGLCLNEGDSKKITLTVMEVNRTVNLNGVVVNGESGESGAQCNSELRLDREDSYVG